MKFKTCSISPRVFYLKHRKMVMKQTGEICIQPKTKIKQTDKTKQNTNKKGMSIAETIVYIIIP